jgi:hypothetical protein
LAEDEMDADQWGDLFEVIFERRMGIATATLQWVF